MTDVSSELFTVELPQLVAERGDDDLLAYQPQCPHALGIETTS
jgi:hypothetical protein